ncbi:MAG: hypothetical protein OEV28_04590 [Nitrospirota bacterium]|nr:hypothetical protein [Nitrospirota bacterium]
MQSRLTFLPILAAPFILALSGCATEGIFEASPQSQTGTLKNSTDYMPPPGKCRIWYRGRDLDQQPPPGECEELKKNIPSDAVLIRG